MRRGVIDIPVRRLLRVFGFDIERKRPVLIDVLREHRIDTLLDVGANVGQYGRRARAWGYRGRIISFEPLADPCRALRRLASSDPPWDVHGFGLGENDGSATINVSEASVFSSIRRGRPELHAAFASAQAVRTEVIRLHRLDSIFDKLALSAGNVFLKVDTQGYEREVLRGARRSLAYIKGVQLEVSLTPLYEGESTFSELSGTMQAHGFEIVLIEPVAYHATSKALLQIDCVFMRV